MTSKTSGLYLDPLFHHGTPGLESMESVLQQVEDELEVNTRELEECVNEILQISNSLPGSKKHHDAKAAIEYMSERNLLEKNSCYDPESQEVSQLLRHVLRTLDKNPGCEESLLEGLLQLSSKEGLSLPIRSSTTEQTVESMVSLNAIIDNSEQVNEALWEEICVKFRRYYIESLNKLPLEGDTGILKLNGNKRWRLIQSLCTLYPSSEVWTRYRSLRSHQFNQYISSILVENGPDNEFDVSSAANHFAEIAKTALKMIDDDFTILNSGVFRKSVTTFQAIQEIYLDCISEETVTTVENIHTLISKESSSKEPTAKSNLHSTVSEYGPIAKLKTNLLKSKSTSLDSLVNKSDVISQNALPVMVLESIVKLVTSVMTLSKHVNHLHHTMIWEVSAGKKLQPKGSLRGVLKTSNSDLHSKLSPKSSPRGSNRRLSSESIHSHFGNPAEKMKFLDAPEVVEKLPHEDKPKWKWRICFRPLIQNVACSVEQLIKDTVQSSLESEQAYFEEHGDIESVSVCPVLVGGRLDYPRQISKSASQIMLLLDKFLPLAWAGSESCFMVVRSAFIDTAVLNLRICHLKLLKMCNQVPALASTRVLYLTMSTAAFIRNHLFHYEQVIGTDDGKKPFNLLYRQFCELTETLSQQVTLYHKQALSTSLLHDAESHHWADSKDFYEGERCSFAIQMWNFHMRALHYDLWTTSPPKMAQTILTTILHHSLTLLTQRYTQVKPSYRRTSQFGVDITTILMCTSELIVPCSNSVSKMVDACSEQKLHNDIHNLCSSLLASLAIVASPLDTLYRVYKKGFYKKRVKKHDPEEDNPTQGHLCQWLAWIRPALFKHGQRLYDDMQTTTALHLQLKLLAAQPEPNWPLVMQALLMKEYTLPIMILSQHPEILKPLGEIEVTSCGKLGCQGVDCLTTKCGHIRNLFKPFFYILVRCTHTPDALAKVLVPAIDRSGGWGVFDLNATLGQTQQIPCWLDAMYDILTPYINRVVEPGIRMLLDGHETSSDVEPLVNVMTELPCGCDLESRQIPRSARSTDSKGLMNAAIESIINVMAEDIHCVPSPLCMFFRVAQQVLHDKNIKTGHNCVGLQVLADCLRLKLSDGEHVTKLLGRTVRQTTLENITQLGECTYHILTANSQGGRNPGSTPRLASSYMKSHREWLSSKTEVITEYFHNEVFEYPETTILEGSTAEFTEHLMMSVASKLMEAEEGRESLLQIHNLLNNNGPWFTAQLDIPFMFNGQERQRAGPFHVLTSAPTQKQFNPLVEYARIGDSKFDHASLQLISWDWTSLLQSDLGLSETTFKTLLYNRHEFQEGAYLEEKEKKPVEVLKGKFDSAPAELV